MTTLTPLDLHLYAWLAEPDDRRFERAFGAYFQLAYPALLRRLARLSRWDAAQLEELAQDALLRFFDRVGRSRRQAATVVRSALGGLRPLPVGPLHERQVSRWTSEVTGFCEHAMRFRPEVAAGPTDWKVGIRALAERIPGLQSEGHQLILSVRLHVLAAEEADAPGQHEDGDAPQLAGRFATQACAATDGARCWEQRLPGLGAMVGATWTISDALPRLRVPTNGYLFEMATTIYLDECKRRHRRKRGGTGQGASAVVPIDALHPLDRMPDGPHAGDDDVGELRGVDVADLPVADPVLQLEHTEFLEKFLDYLREPVARAAEDCLQAQKHGKATAERERLQSLSAKLDRTLAVLGLMGEGCTQEQAAAQLGLSRNQVKYVVEVVQEAYERFASPQRRARRAPIDAGVVRHD